MKTEEYCAMPNIRVESTGQLPSIGIARRDHARLERLADDAVKERHPVGRFLMSEIRRAVVFDTNQIPVGTVRLNEWVTYRVDGGRHSESKILVCPHDLRNGLMELSVLSPLGAALLGMSVGQRMKFFSIGGGLHSVIVESVLAPAGAPVLFPAQSRRRAGRAPTSSPGPDDDGPQAA
ncbi:GreA/GreB family elongation factor [Bradyrhizobium sp. A11]|uniref:GreA/GreB family elongation factor n=1 Tax=Bradyrhizobium sp. A11 TaxID=3133974 RepID=UPI0035C78F8B